MRKTQIEYFCDGCDEQVPTSKDLRKFKVGVSNDSVEFELCGSCEGRFLGGIETFVADEKKVLLFELRRE
jgi:hypothetical protein